jgi:23S rRNA (adenine2503-C2)-methyltransferase
MLGSDLFSFTSQIHFDEAPFRSLKMSRVLESCDGTYKFYFSTEDQLTTEAVLIPFHRRDTLCLSTQVGCGLNCQFCFTAKMGLKRSLTASEIKDQYLLIVTWLKKVNPQRMLPNIVFMGQGEPLQNFSNLKEAIAFFIQKLYLGPRQITVSTVGWIPGIKEFSKLGGVNFALSLHSPFDEERNQIIPLNRKYPLNTLKEELIKIPLKKRQFLQIEYLILQGINHSPLHAKALSEWCQGLSTLINLIPFNPFPEALWSRPSKVECDEFKAQLVQHRLRVFIRTTKGSDIMASCGLLHSDLKSTTEGIEYV